MTIGTQGVAKELQAASLDIPNEADARNAEVVLEVQRVHDLLDSARESYEFAVQIDGRTYVVTVEDTTDDEDTDEGIDTTDVSAPGPGNSADSVS